MPADMPVLLPDLNNRVALVTGGSRGIGRAIAVALASAGAAIAVNYRQRAEEAAQVVALIQGAGRRALAVRADVSAADEVSRMIAEVESGLGAIDVLVNNAGTGTFHDIDALTEAEFDRTLAVNLKSAFLCTQAVLPGMRERRWGRIVNLSSVAARGAGAVGVHYNASKAGLEGLTRGYAARVAREGITRERRGTGAHRHRNGRAAEGSEHRRAAARRAAGRCGGSRAGRADGARQWLRHGADDCCQRGPQLYLIRIVARGHAMRSASANPRCFP